MAQHSTPAADGTNGVCTATQQRALSASRRIRKLEIRRRRAEAGQFRIGSPSRQTTFQIDGGRGRPITRTTGGRNLENQPLLLAHQMSFPNRCLKQLEGEASRGLGVVSLSFPPMRARPVHDGEAALHRCSSLSVRRASTSHAAAGRPRDSVIRGTHWLVDPERRDEGERAHASFQPYNAMKPAGVISAGAEDKTGAVCQHPKIPSSPLIPSGQPVAAR